MLLLGFALCYGRVIDQDAANRDCLCPNRYHINSISSDICICNMRIPLLVSVDWLSNPQPFDFGIFLTSVSTVCLIDQYIDMLTVAAFARNDCIASTNS
ncbi:hypothetical protein L2E82_22901 [Cichorium intybus]|uniref:Uncharacterized protein n=1 Tax=Cichorium intybus TaxID=13427 RepID=A0ACB9DZH4_CICIN|nr:hypothetical protein L2E82_22901 [Cichorium intybus]